MAKFLFCTLAVCEALPVAYATPYTPASDAQVLERLPGRSDPSRQASTALRAQLSRNPNNLPVAVRLARFYIAASRVDGDPRYLGYAQAVLRPWWALQQPPAPVLVLRATILQSTHQFESALVDLDKLLHTDPGNAQAWLTRATVLTVRGEYEQAKTACATLSRLASELIAQTCLASVGSLTGDAIQSYRMLSQTFTRYPDAETGLKIWVLTLLGELAGRLGDDKAAETHFLQAMSLAPPDSYLLAVYTDFLLDHARPGEVIDLLAPKTRSDALLLRYGVALKAQKSPLAVQQTEILRERFAAAMIRGDTTHQREQSRFELHLLGDARRALETARRNWQVQKEPADLRVLLEAATATNDKASMTLALEWIRTTRLEDRTLAKLLAPVGEKS